MPLTLAGVAGAASQTWYLTSEPHSSGADRFVLSTTSPGAASAVTLANGCTNLWMPADAAAIPLSFSPATWTVVLHAQTASTNGLYATNIADYEAGTLTRRVWGNTSFSTDPGTWTPSTAGATPVDAGGFVALEPCGKGGKNALTLHTDGSSYIVTPSDSPPYPTPEGAVLPLTALGLALVGTVALRTGRTGLGRP